MEKQAIFAAFKAAQNDADVTPDALITRISQALDTSEATVRECWLEYNTQSNSQDPKKLSDELRSQIGNLRAQGLTKEQIAAKLGIKSRQVHYVLYYKGSGRSSAKQKSKRTQALPESTTDEIKAKIQWHEREKVRLSQLHDTVLEREINNLSAELERKRAQAAMPGLGVPSQK